MRYKLLICFLIIAVVLQIFSSCNGCSNNPTDNGKDTVPKKDTINKDSLLSQWNYQNDSGKVTVMVLGDNGTMEYVVEKPENIFLKTASGIEYKIVNSTNSAKRPRVGDVLYLDMSYKMEKTNTLLFTTDDFNDEFKMRLSASSDKGCIEEAFMLMSEGDSAVIKVDAIKFFLKSQGKVSIPANINKGDRLVFNIRLKKIVSGIEYAEANKEMYIKRIEEENSLIERFLMGKNFPQKNTDSGLRMLIINKGAGKVPTPGTTVKIDYTAAFIDGAVFDSTLEREEPFSFVTGRKQVIEGLDEAVMNMNVGDHCLVIIPFRLAYGDQKYGNVIPPFSTLVFEIELLDAK